MARRFAGREETSVRAFDNFCPRYFALIFGRSALRRLDDPFGVEIFAQASMRGFMERVSTCNSGLTWAFG